MKFVEWIVMGGCLYIGWRLADYLHYRLRKSAVWKGINATAREMCGLPPIKEKKCSYKRVIGFAKED